MVPFSAPRGNSVLQVFDPSAIAGRTRGAIDSVDYVDGFPGLVRHAQPTFVPRGAPLLVSGWNVDPATGGRPQAVSVLLDRARALDVRDGRSRHDIMAAHGTDEFVGYQLVVATDALGTGAHELRAFALSVDGSWYESDAIGFWVFLHDHAELAQGNLSRKLEMFLEPPIDPLTGRNITPGTPIHANHWIAFRGWTLDETARRSAETIVVTGADERTWCGPAKLLDAAPSGADDGHRGFEVVVPAAVLGRGRHRLRFSALDETGRPYPNSVEGTVDIIGPKRPFPLTARQGRSSPPYAARFYAVEAPTDITELPSVEPIVVTPGAFVMEGWVIDESGEATDDVFGELTATWVDLPPHRLPADGARRKPIDGIPPAPVDDAWFYCPFSIPALQSGVYVLALLVVQRGRRSYSRVPLATLWIGS